MQEGRNTKFIIIIGTNFTGKTTLQKRLVLNELKKKSRALICTPDELEWTNIQMVHPYHSHHLKDYVGARRMIVTKSIAIQSLEIIWAYFNRGMLLFDDCRAFLGANTNDYLESMLIRRRQKEIDIVAAGHNFEKIPLAFFSYATEIILFKTIGNMKTRKNSINEHEKVEAAQLRVNKIAENNLHHYEIINL